MSDEKYRIKAEPELGLLSISLKGFWTDEDFDSYEVSLIQAIRSLGLPPHQHLACVDITGALIQPQPIVARFRAMITTGPCRSRKLALWTASPLSRMQARHMQEERESAHAFGTEAEARAWLLSDTLAMGAAA